MQTAVHAAYWLLLVLLLLLLVNHTVQASHCIEATGGAGSNATAPPAVHHNRDRRYVLSFPINGGVAKVIFGFVAPVRFHHMLKRSLNLGINVQANYRILPNVIFPHPESVWKNRYDGGAGYVDSGRRQLYGLLEKFLGRTEEKEEEEEEEERDGTKAPSARACLLRTICEIADRPLTHNGMVGEILDVVFRYGRIEMWVEGRTLLQCVCVCFFFFRSSPGDSDDLPEQYKMARRYGANGVDCARLYAECPFGHGLLDTVTAMHW